MSFTFEEIAKQIEEKHHVTVPFPLPHKDFEEAVSLFMKFLELPLETKQPIYFRLEQENRGSEVGYVRYLRSEGKTDNREYFHYNEFAEDGLKQYIETVPELRAFIERARVVYAETKTSIEEIIRAFEPKFPGIYEQFFPADEKPRLFLRFLKYDRGEPGEFLAKGHYDRGALALALAESAPGLRMGLNDQHLTEVVHNDKQALFMPGIRFQQITSPEFPPTWHDVVQKTDDAFNDDTARWAVVCFADQKGPNTITYEQAHTPQTY